MRNLIKYNKIRYFLWIMIVITHISPLHAQKLRWNLNRNQGISWIIKENDTFHTDHLEMSGSSVSVIVTYGINEKRNLVLSKELIFPMLRTIPNNTNASYHFKIADGSRPPILVNGLSVKELVQSFNFDGTLQAFCNIGKAIRLEVTAFPSRDKAAFIEEMVIINSGSSPVKIEIPSYEKNDTSDYKKGVSGSYIINSKTEGSGIYIIPADGRYKFYNTYIGRASSESKTFLSGSYERKKREKFLNDLNESLVLKTPNDTINQLFSFCKIRASESIFDTHDGLMHAPGGGPYYAAIWANDEGEYVSPFFPYLGNEEGIESALNCYRIFSKYINPEYKPIPSSIIAEGLDTWNGAGDRGDQAMLMYGASSFALAHGDSAGAQKLWPLIEWCYEYLRRKTNAEGVIESDSDEMEGRFSAGKANLSTNSLAYGGMIAGSHLANELGKKDKALELMENARTLHANIDKYFGATLEGFKTYKYHKENVKLRAWICLPLVMGIFERKEQTIKALLSDNLWSNNGILTESGDSTFWDRSTICAFRGLFFSGATELTLPYFNYYSSQRLLGEHVPYPVEAWPEGGQRHLSAESGLYCRAVIEGLFGITPLGFNKFSVKPSLPVNWNKMELNHVKAFKNDFSVVVIRSGKKLKISISNLSGKLQTFDWDGKSPVEVTL